MLERGEYGLFFPGSFSPSGFSFSVGQLYLGFSQKELHTFGALMLDPKRSFLLAPKREDQQPVSVCDLPDRPCDIPPDFAGMIPIYDAIGDRSFSLLPAELTMRLHYGWSLPNRHFLSRLTDLVHHANSPVEEKILCTSCQQSIVTFKNSLFSERRVFCQPCYLSFLETHG